MAIKKTIKRAAKPVKTAPVATAPACSINGGCSCGCRCGFFKKLIILGLAFAAGFATCHYMCAKHGFRDGMHPMHQNMFINDCLDTAKINNPMMAEKIATADKDGNGCITVEEVNAHHEEMRGNQDMGPKPMMRK